MSARPKSIEYSEDPAFGVSSLFTVNFAVSPPHYFIDGTDLGPVSDLGGPQGLYELIGEFITDTGAVDLVKRTAGGLVVTRAVGPGVDTVALGARPPVPFARVVALRNDVIAPEAANLGISLT